VGNAKKRISLPQFVMESRLFDHSPFLPSIVECAKSKQCFNDFLYCLTDVYYQTDMAGTILTISPSCKIHLGYLPEEMIGKKMADFYFNPEERAKIVEQFIANQGKIARVEAILKHKDGSQVWASTDACIRFNDQGVPQIVEGISRNISEQKDLEAQLRKEIVSRRMITQVLCHDLATPINNILGLVDLGPEFVAQHLGLLVKSANVGKDLIGIVQHLHHFDETSELPVSKVSLEEVLESLKTSFQNRLSAKNLTLHVESAHDLFVKAERVTLEHSVIANFLTNAIKFSERGSAIWLSAKKETNNICVAVRDQGIGMSKTMQSDLFDLSKKTSRLGTANEAGTGWGMKLAQFFVKKYGGEIVVESKSKKDDPQHSGTLIKAFIPAFVGE